MHHRSTWQIDPVALARILRSVAPQIRPLLQAAHKQRYRLEKGSRHVKVIAPREQLKEPVSDQGRVSGGMVVVSCTPSDTRSVNNTRAQLRRIGVQLP